MAEQGMFRVGVVAAARAVTAPVVCAVALDMFPVEAKWERALRGMLGLKKPLTTLGSLGAELLEAAVAVAAPCAADSA
jgi:hypothetical protein